MGTRTFLVLVAIFFVLLCANAYFAVTYIRDRHWFWACMNLFGVMASVFLIFAAYANRRTVN
jgi:hypothetical protein